ncbi:FCD domain-containing protein [Arthrobacter sp. H5]|uniref:FadR/GntR family transcriptional regulator n=1 Tax=Arthrobacter sp. H5 TaxID=1267973 RepID=UPI000484C3A1|nr:FCD domain-containing protein [Arthrobacter sp. H5]
MSMVSRRTLTDQVSEALLQFIADEDLTPGDALPPAGELARRFDVSNVVIREAVAKLAGLGVLSRRQGREPIISLPGSDVLGEILSIHARQERILRSDFLVCRAALEVESAGLAAQHGSPESRTAVLKPRMDTLRDAGNRAATIDADLALHLAVADLSKNRALKVILMSIMDAISAELTGRVQGQGASTREATLRHHEAIVEAIISGDVPTARQAMIEHFEVALPGFTGTMTG